MNKSPNLRVLVVDDEALIRWSLVETLGDAGLSVVEASDGQSAVRTLTEGGPFDVVVLDYCLPDSNDLSLLATIRRLSPLTAVVMMTAFDTPDVSSGALECGAFRVVAKPFDMHHMADVVLEAHGHPLRDLVQALDLLKQYVSAHLNDTLSMLGEMAPEHDRRE